MPNAAFERWLKTKGIESRQNEISDTLNSFSPHRFEYPWDGIEKLLKDDTNHQIRMIGYGSLMHPQSAARTISDTPPNGHPPVIAWGARRLFDYVIPRQILGQYNEPRTENQRAALNTIWTGDATDFLNGRAIELALKDLPGLRQRELDYDLMPVVWLPWHERDSTLQLGFVLCAKQNTPATSKEIRSLPTYKEVCVEGARMVSEEFESCFWDTTFQSDGLTLEQKTAG